MCQPVAVHLVLLSERLVLGRLTAWQSLLPPGHWQQISGVAAWSHEGAVQISALLACELAAQAHPTCLLSLRCSVASAAVL